MERTTPIIFDIETGPLDPEEIERLTPPFEPSAKDRRAVMEEFDPLSVRHGRTKDPDKLTAQIETARERHATDAAAAIKRIDQARSDYMQRMMDDAPLSPLTGHVLAIGYRSDKARIDGRDERSILVRFWDVVKTCRDRGRLMIGFNIVGFDLPFLVRRSWILGLQWPHDIIDRDRFWSPIFVDLMERWRLGLRGDFVSLDTLARGLRIGSKPEGVDGGQFHNLWTNDRPEAEKYLLNDLDMTWQLARRLGAIIESGGNSQ